MGERYTTNMGTDWTKETVFCHATQTSENQTGRRQTTDMHLVQFQLTVSARIYNKFIELEFWGATRPLF